MFDLDPGDDLTLVVETARKFGAEELAPRARAAEANRTPPPEVFAAYAGIGLADLELPEACGGAGLGCLARVAVNEELGAADPGAALALDRFGPALGALLEMGGDAAARALVAAVEPAERALLVTDADAAIDLVRGSFDLPWAPADEVRTAVLLAGDSALLVRASSVDPLRGAGLRAAGAARVHADAFEPTSRWSDARGAARARARARLYTASLLVGVMRAACDFSREYAQQREAFGRPIAHHQALAFLITDMQIAVDAARLLVAEAAWRVDRGLECAAEAASAYAECIEASRLVGPSAVQILGGHGFMADYPVEKHMREARALGLSYGGYDSAVEEAGRLLALSDAPLCLAVAGAL